MTDKKDEYWKRDKGFLHRARINFSLWFMQFQRKTHGMGLLFFLIMFVLLGNAVINLVTTLIDNQKHDLQEFEKRVICMQYRTCIWGVSYG